MSGTVLDFAGGATPTRASRSTRESPVGEVANVRLNLMTHSNDVAGARRRALRALGRCAFGRVRRRRDTRVTLVVPASGRRQHSAVRRAVRARAVQRRPAARRADERLLRLLERRRARDRRRCVHDDRRRTNSATASRCAISRAGSKSISSRSSISRKAHGASRPASTRGRAWRVPRRARSCRTAAAPFATRPTRSSSIRRTSRVEFATGKVSTRSSPGSRCRTRPTTATTATACAIRSARRRIRSCRR